MSIAGHLQKHPFSIPIQKLPLIVKPFYDELVIRLRPESIRIGRITPHHHPPVFRIYVQKTQKTVTSIHRTNGPGLIISHHLTNSVSMYALIYQTSGPIVQHMAAEHKNEV